MIFQDPLASLNPRMPIGDIIAEPLKIYQPHLSRNEVKLRVQNMMKKWVCCQTSSTVIRMNFPADNANALALHAR